MNARVLVPLTKINLRSTEREREGEAFYHKYLKDKVLATCLDTKLFAFIPGFEWIIYTLYVTTLFQAFQRGCRCVGSAKMRKAGRLLDTLNSSPRQVRQRAIFQCCWQRRRCFNVAGNGGEPKGITQRNL